MKQDLPNELKEKKASQVFLEYCAPMLDDLSDEDAQNLEFIEEAFRVPWMIWNSVVLEEKKKNQPAWHNRMKMMARSLPYTESLLDFWRRRKVEHFDQYKYLMGNFKLVPRKGYTFSLKMEARSIN